MKHYGDITKINGAEVPIVDIITGGSPCQDLSVAGKREGLAGQRSGLFMEQVRIVKEMREHDRADGRADEYIRPRYMVWENVPGAFSSNKGKDFQAVLTEIVRIVKENAGDVPLPDKGRWPHAGCLMGIGDNGQPFSVAYRLHDAQFWGVPQRRKRIALVADFGGTSAPEILFERKGVSRDIAESGEEREETAGDTGKGIDSASGTLRVEEHEHQPIVYGISAYESNAMKSPNPNSGIYEADTSRTLDNNGGNPACNQGGMMVVSQVLMDAYQHHGYRQSETCGTLTADQNQSIRGDTPIVLEGNGSRPSHRGDGYAKSETMFTLNSTEQHAVCVGNGQMCNITMKPIANTLDTMHDQQAIITYGLDRASFNQGQNAKYDFSVEEELAQPLVARGPGGVMTTEKQ